MVKVLHSHPGGVAAGELASLHCVALDLAHGFVCVGEFGVYEVTAHASAEGVGNAGEISTKAGKEEDI